MIDEGLEVFDTGFFYRKETDAHMSSSIFLGKMGFTWFHMNMLNQLHNMKEIGAMENDNFAEILQLRTLSAFQVPPLHDLCAETLGPSPSGTFLV